MQVARAWQDVRSAGAQLEAAQVGAATLVEVTQARTAQVQAAATLVSARYALAFQRLPLRYYVGELEVEDVALG